MDKIYIVPRNDNKPIKIIDEGIKFIDNHDGTVTVCSKATLRDIADIFDIDINSLIRNGLGVFTHE